MFGWTPSRSNVKTPARKRALIALEQLETRDCPAAPIINSLTAVPLNSGQLVQLQGSLTDENPAAVSISFSGVVGGSTTVDAFGNFQLVAEATALGLVFAQGLDDEYLYSNLAQSEIASSSPVVSLELSHGAARTVTVSGTVTDEDPGQRTVNFTGVISGSVLTDSTGFFTFTTEATGLGAIQAVTADAWSQSSNTAQVDVTSAAPAITSVSIAYGAGRTVTISGSVADDDPGSCIASFAGVVVGSTSAMPDGSFSFTAEASALGNVQVTAQDGWGQSSNPASVDVAAAPPQIVDFQAIDHGDGLWEFRGQVVGPNAAGQQVNLGGLPSLNGQYATTDMNGYFSVSVQLQPNENGTATATTTDQWGQQSNQAEAPVDPTPPECSLGYTLDFGHWVTLFGTVTDDFLTTYTVTFSGVVNGTTQVNLDGSYSYTAEASGLGTIYATATNNGGQSSSPVEVTLTSDAPLLNFFSITNGPDRMVTLTGMVSDESPVDAAVFFFGMVEGFAFLNPDGSFSYTAEATGLGTIQAVAVDGWDQTSNVAEVEVVSSAPSITLQVSHGPGRTITVFGTVTDDSPASSTVTLSGVVAGSVAVNSDGTFTYTGEATGLGSTEATASDVWGQSSSPAQAAVVSNVPSITALNISYGTGRTVTITGTISDEDPNTCMVTFAGAVAGTASIYGDGSFSFTAEASGLGTIQVTAQDAWGQSSTAATIDVVVAPPQIMNFEAIDHGDGFWEFRGQVVGPNAAGQRVDFGGVPSLNGQYATTDANGYFSFGMQLQPGEFGTASAITADQWGQQSNLAEAPVDP